MYKMKTVNDIYKISKGLKPLLSSYPEDFWKDYINNYEKYDKIFRNTYLSFKYFIQDGSETVEEVLDDFTNSVYNLLLLNSKKYNELYRIYLNNSYDFDKGKTISEISTNITTDNSTNIYGERNDVSNNQIGAREDTTTNINNAYSDTVTNTNNAYSDTINNNNGTRIDTNITIKDAYEDNLTHTDNGYTTNVEEKVVPYDVSDEQKSNITDNTVGEKVYTEKNNKAQQKETENITIGAQNSSITNEYGEKKSSTTNQYGEKKSSITLNKGAENDTINYTKGNQTDTINKESNNKYEKVITNSLDAENILNVMEKHKTFWNDYEFYSMIFRDIAKELLLV